MTKRSKLKRWNPRKRKTSRAPFDREAWMKKYITNALNKVWNWYPPRRDAKDYAEKNGCASCGANVLRSQIDVDHIEPKVPTDYKLSQPIYWTVLISRWFCEASNLQGLCKPCHKKKTNAENAARRKLK